MTASNFQLVTRLVAFVTLLALGSTAAYAGGPPPDTDGDGVNDYADNCLLVANPLQIDTDGDGFGNFCDGDFNQDNFVNLLDLGFMRIAFFNFVGDANYDPDIDMNSDGGINFPDLNLMKVGFYQPPGPGAINAAPTDIALDNASVDENQPAGTAVGSFSTTDLNPFDTHTYTLVAGVGDTDNGSFGITGDVLETAAIFNFETQSSFSIRVQTDDGNGGLYEEVFTITVNDLNDDPTDIALDSTSVDENQPTGTAVGNFTTTDEDTADTHTYTLVAGTGDTDNASFGITGDVLETAAIFDFETQSSFSIRVQTDDGNGGQYEEVFTITVNDLNDAPTDIALDSTDVDELQPPGTAVGNFSTTDVDSAGPFTYTLVAGAGDTGNAAFGIVGSQLQTAAIFDFETQSSYSIRVQTDDGSGGLYEEVFTITVNDLNDDPTDIALDSTDVDENQAVGTAVGTLSTTDVDSAGPFTYTLVAGAGDTGNASFGITGDVLETAAIFDFETQSSYSIRVQTDDGSGGLYEEVFTITVNDLNDDPTDIALDNTDVDENQAIGTAVGTFSSTDVDSAGPFTYTLVAGAGDTDNASFGITGDMLETGAIFDFETQSSYSIRVQTDDGSGGLYEEVFTITVNDLNDAPTDIALDSTDVDELQPSGTAVGNFSTTDVDSAGPFTYTLVAGAGDTGNAAFGIVGGQLQTAAIFDFETQSSYSIRVQTDDGSGGLYEEVFTITVNDLNDDPTDIALDSTDVDENQPAGTAVGTFSSTDVDSAGPFTYTLVAGIGDTDNASFGVTGDVLETAAIFDFETQSSYSIRVQTDDGSGGLYEEVFTITVNDLNDDPTDIALDNTDVDENQAIGTAVGTFSSTDVDSAGPFTYTLVAGTGDTDNASFGITGDMLETGAIFDFETQSSYSIRVQTDDGSGGLYEEVFTITVNDLNDAPTDIALDSTDVDEAEPAGTAVGNFSTTDVDSAGPFTYTLVAGTGDTDNASFGVTGSVLETAAIFDFDVQSSYSIRVQTDDGSGGLYEEVFTITVNSLNNDPTDIALSNSSVDENQPSGTAVGTFTTTDIDPDTHTYTLVAGAGDTDNASFGISGAVLETAAIFDFETKSSYSIRVQTDDGNGGLYEEAFTITVNDLNEDPTDIALDNADVDENEPVGTAVGSFTTTDMDPADSHTYTLVAGVGDTGNASFGITGSVLETAAVFDFETQSSYSIRVQTDDGNGGLFEEAFTITVNDINDAPVATDDPYTGAIGNVRFALVTALSGTTPVPPTVELVGDIDTNDTDQDSADTLTVTANASIPTVQGGTVSVDANGQFVYSPPAGFPGSGVAADSFTYEICDNGAPVLCDNGTVTIEGTSMVWFVDDSSPNNPGLGTSDDPFRDLSSAGGPSLVGEPIFVFSGTQTTGITLKNNQSLLGEGVALVINATTLVDAGTRPVIANAGGTAVTLGPGNTIRGLDITGSQQGIVGSSFGTLTADNMAISTTGGAGVDLTSGAGSVTFDSLSSSASSTSGIDLDSVTGTFTLGSGAISGSTGPGIDITSSTATVSYGGTVAAGSNLAVNITGHSANSVSLSGNITSSGQGILLNANTGGTINLSGGMSLSTGAFTAFSATNGGTVNVTGTNTVTTSTATAVAIVATTIGGSGVTFQSITSTGAGANAGIILDDTGSGTFTIAGTGGNCSIAIPTCTGGTISNKSDTAVTFNNTGGRITFNDLRIQDIGSTAGGFNTRSGHDGIHGQDVNGGLTLDNVLIQRVSDNCVNGSLFSNGITATFWNGLDILNSTISNCNRFHVAGVADSQDEGAVRIAGLTGTVSVDNNIFSFAGEHLDLFTHSSGTLNMTVTNNFFIDAYQEYSSPFPGGVVSLGGFCVDVTVEGSSHANVTIGGAGGSNDFENCGTGSIRVAKDTVPAGSSNIDFIVDNNTFRVTDQTDATGSFGNTPQGGVLLRAGPGAVTTFDGIVSNNTFGISIGPNDRIGSTGEEIANADGVGGNVVLIFDSGVSQARVNNNVFNGSINAPWVNRADGNTSAAVLYKDNSYRGRDDYCCDSGFAFTVPGIPYRTQSRNGGSLDITFENDQMVHHDQFFFAATETLEFLTRNDSGFPGGTMCMAFKNAAAGDGYEFKETSGTMELYQGAVNNAATGPCGVEANGHPVSDCELEAADDGVRGGPVGHTPAGAPNAALNPPHFDVDAGSITITPTACTLPSGGIFN